MRVLYIFFFFYSSLNQINNFDIKKIVHKYIILIYFGKKVDMILAQKNEVEENGK